LSYVLKGCNIAVQTKGVGVRLSAYVLTGLIGLLASAAPAHAATLYFFVDAETFEQRSIKIDLDGPDKAYLCVLPPGTAGCQEVPLKRKSR
jgi:hypothetical protein